MLIVHVFIHVKSECIADFQEATLANTRNSIQEPGIARFDFIKQIDDPNQFVLVEVYRTPAAAGKHKETAHYKVWRDTVAPMMAEARSSIKYSNLAPSDLYWDSIPS